MIDNEIGTQNIEKRKKVIATKLNWRRRQQHDRLCIVAKISDALVQERLAITDVVRFIDDHEIESGGRIKLQ